MPTRALIPIPTNMTVVGSKCVQISLPNDAEWQAMFWGALYQLTAWNSYDRDDVQSGAYCAGIWKSIIDEARASECAMQPMFQQNSPCELQVSFDGGTTWSTIYSGQTCIQANIDDGTIQAGPAARWTFTYDFTAGTQGCTAPQGHYESGQGFVTDLVVGGAHPVRILDVLAIFPATGHVTSYEIEFLFTTGVNGCPTAQAGDWLGMSDVDPASPFATSYCPHHASPWKVLREAVTDRVVIRLYPGWDPGSSDPGGSATLQRLTLEGLGVNPFL